MAAAAVLRPADAARGQPRAPPVSALEVEEVNLATEGLTEAVEAINGRSRPLRIGTPCAGFEAPYFALRQLGIQNFEQTFVVDVAPHATKFSRNLQHAKTAWLGQDKGDLLRLDLTVLPAVNVLIAGPPCPPWSWAGHRKGEKDPRAEVFWRVIDLIAELVRRPGDDALRCFVLENVEGIKFEDHHGRRGIDEVLRRLRTSVPAFKIRIYDMNTQDYSLPQNRARVYIVGVHKSLEVRGRSFCTPLKHRPCPKLQDWLVPKDKVADQFLQVPERLREKKRKWDEALAERAPAGWRIACADIDRPVESSFAQLRFEAWPTWAFDARVFAADVAQVLPPDETRLKRSERAPCALWHGLSRLRRGRMVEAMEDPIVKALQRSRVHQALKEARASLAEPSRPYTPLDRSLFQRPNEGSDSRPTSSYGVDQVAFVRDTFGTRPDSARSSRSGARSRPDTITEEGAEVLRLDEEAANSSGSEELTPVVATPSPPNARSAPGSAPERSAPSSAPKPPRPPGYSSGSLRSGYPEAPEKSPAKRLSSSSPRLRLASLDGSPHRQRSLSPAARLAALEPANPCKIALGQLKSLKASKDTRPSFEDFQALSERILALAKEMKAGADTSRAPELLREIMGLMDLKELKESKYLFKLARCALTFLPMEAATKGVPVSGVQAAYHNIAQVLFKYSQKEGHDAEFLSEKLVEPLIEVLESRSDSCSSTDLMVYIVGTLKNVSNDSATQKFLAQRGAVSALFRLLDVNVLTGNPKEVPLLIQVTASLRNLASREYKQFLSDERLNALTNILASYPGHVELLTNVARILAKLTLHGSAVDAIAMSDVLNVVAAITNLLFYDVPSNLLFQEDTKQLLCRLFRPLLLESYNIEALIESARALGNLSRHADARQCMSSLRLDEILVILLDHDDRDLAFYACGALVNLAADPESIPRLTDATPAVPKLTKLLADAPADDPALQLVAIKVLTNLSLDSRAAWPMEEVDALRGVLVQTIADSEEVTESSERQQLLDLARHLQSRLPASTEPSEVTEERPDWFYCSTPGCGRRFGSQNKLNAHVERRHKEVKEVLE
ncbi:Modification methylase Rho11sI (M.Rho11sI) (Bsu P11s) (Cytosine-specific methyltransferase Rho11sI) [Durusdinium trenchii]|uniref:Modification methylase Rho11sI (M.Rho11sI) (Bsu P11s) (Cytosine-specific methyltransferase Rho11sI) n=1 Tax=Durusdinium trenchii TaxID=1381693 RepID=A0ABP0MP43_9DINO